LTEEERTAFNLNNFNIQFVNQEAVVSLDLTKSVVKKDEYYSNFFQFLSFNNDLKVSDLKYRKELY